MSGQWTDHDLLQLKERNISKEHIENALNDPDDNDDYTYDNNGNTPSRFEPISFPC